ncbi:MAG: trigger factor [Spirochaetaceae bacterium]|nr:trigger factor [Spirochaetaceae bacterium]
MIKNKEITRLEHSRVKLSLTIDKESAEKEYSGLLAKYSKEAHIAGFRKGKVPPAVLERKFGDSIKAEAAEKIIEENLKTVFAEIEEKPITFEAPELQDDYKLSFDEDFSFAVAYDIFPAVDMGPYTQLTVEKPQVNITEDDEKRELDALVEQNSFVVEKDGTAEKDNTATVDFWELDETGEEIPGSRKQDMPFTVGGGYDIYGLDGEVTGMEKGGKKEITKTYPEDYREKDLAGKAKKFVVELKGLREKKRPELNDELAQDISDSYATLDDLKKDIKRRLEESAASRTRSLTVDALMDQVVEKSSIDLPESMIRAEQDRLWRQFTGQFRVSEESMEKILAAQGKTKDDLFAEWRPRSEKSLKIQICIQKMIEAEKIEATDEELSAYFNEQAEGSSMSAEDMEGYYRKNNLLDMARHDLQEKKLFDLVLEKNTITGGKQLSFTDAMGGGG